MVPARRLGLKGSWRVHFASERERREGRAEGEKERVGEENERENRVGGRKKERKKWHE